jgi:hypothetical protein
MKQSLKITAALLLTLALTPSFALAKARQDTTPKQDIKDAGSSTKNAV